jgi:hypothetical protein
MDDLLDLINNNLMTVAGGVLGGFLGLLLSYREIGKLFRVLRTSTSEIASLHAEEQVEIVGKADGETTLRSPITKTPCVLWQVTVSERRSSGRSSHWVTVYSNTSTAPFYVHDGTGRMQVHPGPRMELLLRDDVSQSSSIFNSLDEQVQTALNEMGVNTKGFLNLNKPMRVQERFIETGDQIYLLGKTSSNIGGQVMDNDSPLIVSDHSELRLLSGFSWRVIVNIMIGIISGAALAIFFTNR